jgi:hypothetical protein
MRSILSRFKTWPLWAKIAILVLVVALLGGVAYWVMPERAVTVQAATLRTVKGTAEIRKGDEGDWIEARDMALLYPGDWIRGKKGDEALIQYFDGSSSLLIGSFTAQLAQSWQFNLAEGGKTYAIKEAISLGKAITWVATVPSLSSFQLETPGSVAAVQGTILEVVVDEQGGARWSVMEGEIKVVAVVVTKDKEYAAVLIPLKAGDRVALPPPPQELMAEKTIADKVISLVSELAKESVRQQKSDVQVGGLQVAGLNMNTGTAVYTLTVSELPPPTTPSPTPTTLATLGEKATMKEDELLEQLVPGVALSTEPIESLPTIPVLTSARPKVQAEPPRYQFSIYGVTKPLGVAVDSQRRRIYCSSLFHVGKSSRSLPAIR